MSSEENTEDLGKIAEALGVMRCCGTALGAMSQYSENTIDEIEDMIIDFDSLPSVYHRLAPGYIARLEKCQDLVKENGKIVNDLIEFYKKALKTRPKEVQRKACNCGCYESDDDEEDCKGNSDEGTKEGRHSEHDHDHSHKHHHSSHEHDKDDDDCGDEKERKKQTKKVAWEHQQMAQNIVMQFYREWSEEGIVEREECFVPIITRCKKYAEKKSLKCLVPGAGMCRLAYDLAVELPTVTIVACEVSHAMILPAQFLLGGRVPARKYTVYPFAHVTGNINHAETMQLVPVHVPDVSVDPSILLSGHLTVTTQEFQELCEDQPREGGYDMLVTCFFIDTSFNILDYIQSATRLLKPGGIWVNSGPLHWVHNQRESIRLSMDEIMQAMDIAGFEMLEEPTVLPYRHYCSPPGSLMPMVFDCCVWVARMTE